jgi:hypothetical protein
MINYYVDSINGLDTNSGLSFGNSYKTIQALLNGKTSFTEDTNIYLQKGTYICDNTLVTKIQANVSLNIIGMKKDTTFTPNSYWGSVGGGWNAIGIKGASLSINSLIFNMQNMASGNSSTCLLCNFKLNNVVISNIPSTSFGIFSPWTSVYTFTNCLAIGLNPVSARLDGGTLKIYNSYGNFSNGYASTTDKWNIENNVIISTPVIDDDYRITQIGVSPSVGLYSGIYTWGFKSLLKKNNEYYSIRREFYDTGLQQYSSLDVVDFDNQSFYIHELFNEIKIGGETIDKTPIMTSNTTPSPFVASASSIYDAPYLPYKAFNNLIGTGDCWLSKGNSTPQWILIDLSSNTKINKFRLTSRNYAHNSTITASPKNFKLQGSNDGLIFDDIKSFINQSDWTYNETREFILDDIYDYRYYRLYVVENNGNTDYVAISKLELHYKSPLLAQFKPIDKFNNFQLITNEKPNLINILATKSTSELISSNGDIPTYLSQNIDYFKLTPLQDKSGQVKMVLSKDGGKTWLTYNLEEGITPLINTIPLNNYQSLSREEQIKWDNAKSEIIEKGMDVATFNAFDFNTLDAKTIRFAYVLVRPTYTDTAETDKLEWQFDAKGYMMLMGDAEGDMFMYEKDIRYISSTANPIIKLTAMV